MRGAAIALHLLAAPVYAHDASLVTEYLDFRVSLDREGPVVARRLPPPQESYPAVHTLLAMGVGAAPAVLDVLRNRNASPMSRQNALLVFRFLHRGQVPSAVRKLRQASLLATDPTVAAILFESAQEIAEKCIGNEAVACRAMLR